MDDHEQEGIFTLKSKIVLEPEYCSNWPIHGGYWTRKAGFYHKIIDELHYKDWYFQYTIYIFAAANCWSCPTTEFYRQWKICQMTNDVVIIFLLFYSTIVTALWLQHYCFNCNMCNPKFMIITVALCSSAVRRCAGHKELRGSATSIYPKILS